MKILFPLLCVVLLACSARADWNLLRYAQPGPVRGVTRLDNGHWLGARLGGGAVSIVTAGPDGLAWRFLADVTRNDALGFGDPMVLAVPGTHTVFCAFRTRANDVWRVLVYRSENGGRRWAYDSTIAGPSKRFVGAPWLFLAPNGDLQCYYDSEPMAAEAGYPGFQWIAMVGRKGIHGPWTHYGLVTASREEDPRILTRDGMPTVVSLGGDHLLCVTEGVLPGHGNANVVRAIESRDGGRTWDFAGRRILYRSRVDAATDRRFNAYAPFALAAHDGTVWVAFGTDEDYGGPPDFSHAPVHERHSHVKVIHARAPWKEWTAPETAWSASFTNYIPGLFERGPGEITATIHLFDGRDALLARPASPRIQ